MQEELLGLIHGYPVLKNIFNVGKITAAPYYEPGGVVGLIRDTTADESKLLNCYYISTTKESVGSWSGKQEGIQYGTQYTEEQLKSENFVTTLNSYIESNTDSIDTTGWSEWETGEYGYPVHKQIEEES